MNGWIELARARSQSGEKLVLREQAGTIELRCDGRELMSNRAHYSEQAMGPYALADRRWREVLIGGLGFGYTLRAALDCLPAQARVTVAELMPEVIAWNRGVLARLAGHPLSDPRVRVICCDVVDALRPEAFDAVLLDTDNGPDSVMIRSNVRLYLADGLRAFRHALRPDGGLAVWSADRSPRFEENIRRAGLQWRAYDVPARGGADDPRHTIYLGWRATCDGGRDENGGGGSRHPSYAARLRRPDCGAKGGPRSSILTPAPSLSARAEKGQP